MNGTQLPQSRRCSSSTYIGDIPIVLASQEIADLTGKRHDHVIPNIRKILVNIHGEGGVLKFVGTLVNPQNQMRYPVSRLSRANVLA